MSIHELLASLARAMLDARLEFALILTALALWAWTTRYEPAHRAQRVRRYVHRRRSR